MHDEKIAVLSIVVVVLIASVYLVFFVLSPSFFSASGPKPSLGEGELVEPVHIKWLVTELGAGKLQPLSGRSPQVEFVVKPNNNYFTMTIEGGVPRVVAGRADDPDIRLTGNRDVVARMLAADDLFAEIRKLDSEGKVTLEMLRERNDLVSFGYESLYNQLTSG